MSKNWVADMATMHHKFGVNPVARNFDKEKARAFLEFRIRFLQEELDEMKKAMEDFDAEIERHKRDGALAFLGDTGPQAADALNRA